MYNSLKSIWLRKTSMSIEDNIKKIINIKGGRKIIIVDGSFDFVHTTLKNTCDFIIDEENIKNISKSLSHLGNEYNVVGINAYNRFNPEIMSSLVGLIKTNGSLFIGCKNFLELDNSTIFHDCDADRFKTNPKVKLKNLYLKRFKNNLLTCNNVWIINEIEGIIKEGKIIENHKLDNNNHQINTIQIPNTINDWIENYSSTNSFLFIDGERGTGKSLLLGFIAKKLLSFNKKIVISTQNKLSLTNFFVYGKGTNFIGISELLNDDLQIDILLIDEIGTIPIQMLKKITLRFHHIIFCGTSYGYEGTSRGINLKLLPFIEEQNIKITYYSLTQKYRYENDELDTLWKKLFLPNNISIINNIDLFETKIKKINQEDLYNDEQLLSNIFGILQTYHYQTQPSDLRQLLDNPLNELFILEINKTIVGVLWGCFESINEKLVSEVFLGNRRPKGNIIPQTLVNHCGFINAGFYRYFRIMRIAIIEQFRHHKFASKLINYAFETLKNSIDFMGVSFGVTENLQKFWHFNGFYSVKMGFKEDHVSGLCSIIMLKPRTKILKKVQLEWYEYMIKELLHTSCWHHKNQSSKILLNLFENNVQNLDLDSTYQRNIKSLTLGHRNFDQTIQIILTWIMANVSQWKQWEEKYQKILIEHFLQHKNYDDIDKNVTEKQFVEFFRNELTKNY